MGRKAKVLIVDMLWINKEFTIFLSKTLNGTWHHRERVLLLLYVLART